MKVHFRMCYTFLNFSTMWYLCNIENFIYRPTQKISNTLSLWTIIAEIVLSTVLCVFRIAYLYIYFHYKKRSSFTATFGKVFHNLRGVRSFFFFLNSKWYDNKLKEKWKLMSSFFNGNILIRSILTKKYFFKR